MMTATVNMEQILVTIHFDFQETSDIQFRSEITGFGGKTLDEVQTCLLGRELYLAASFLTETRREANTGFKKGSPLFAINTND